MDNLKNKVVLITGASGDIGEACADLFYKNGAILILHSFNHEIKKYPKGRVFYIKCNTTSEIEVQKQFSLLKKDSNLKKIDILINNAGDLLDRVPAEKLEWDFVQRTLDVNLKSAFLFTKFSLPLMKKGSSIIFISSLTARSGKGDRSSAYSLSKGALISWSKSLANELGTKRKIRVNCITPGYIKGKFHKRYTKKNIEMDHKNKNPLGRLGQPTDVAHTALFYASDSSSYITGTTLDVCGGEYIN
jgi:3-oxoacyl-[acyl-carrier protein] reductase